MGISGLANLTRANTTYRAEFQALFGGQPKGTWSRWTQVIQNDGRSFEIPVVTAFPRIRQWLGSKQFKELRAYRQNIEVKTWEASIAIDRTDLAYDKTGAVDGTLKSFLGQNESIYEDLMVSSTYGGLLSNPTGYDGSTLLADAHGNTGGNADNSADAQLSFAAWRTGREAMRDVADEDGRLLDILPTTLLVGPELERLALEIAGPVRQVPVSNAGVQDAGAAVVASVLYTNYLGQNTEVIVSPYITDDSWFMMDLSKAGLRPFIWVENRKIEAVINDGMESEPRFQSDEFQYSLELDGAQGAGLWQLIYGEANPS